MEQTVLIVAKMAQFTRHSRWPGAFNDLNASSIARCNTRDFSCLAFSSPLAGGNPEAGATGYGGALLDSGRVPRLEAGILAAPIWFRRACRLRCELRVRRTNAMFVLSD